MVDYLNRLFEDIRLIRTQKAVCWKEEVQLNLCSFTSHIHKKYVCFGSWWQFEDSICIDQRKIGAKHYIYHTSDEVKKMMQTTNRTKKEIEQAIGE